MYQLLVHFKNRKRVIRQGSYDYVQAGLVNLANLIKPHRATRVQIKAVPRPVQLTGREIGAQLGMMTPWE